MRAAQNRQGWITPRTLVRDIRCELSAMEQQPAVVRIAPATADLTSLIFENRQRIRSDAALAGEGLIVWSVADSDVNAQVESFHLCPG
jgi:hypothetical protein